MSIAIERREVPYMYHNDNDYMIPATFVNDEAWFDHNGCMIQYDEDTQLWDFRYDYDKYKGCADGTLP